MGFYGHNCKQKLRCWVIKYFKILASSIERQRTMYVQIIMGRNREICWFWPPNGHDSFTLRQKCQRFSTKCVLFSQSNLIAVYLLSQNRHIWPIWLFMFAHFFKSLKTILMANYIILRHWAQHIMDDSWLATGLPGNQHDLSIQMCII